MPFFCAFSEWVSFLVAVCLVIFLFFDEEPLLDPTDWNIVHVVLLLLSILIVTWENIVRSRYGQFVYKDQVLLFSTFSFWFSIENWSRLIVVGFCFHCLTPLELELLELNDVYLNLMVWYTTGVLPFFIILLLSYFIVLILNANLNWLNYRFFLFSVLFLFFLLLLNFLSMLWDFLLSSLSSFNFLETKAQLYYNNTRASISYNSILHGEDFFDWHISNSGTFIFRFEDLYLYFLQLFNIVALYTALFVLIFLILDVVLSYSTTKHISAPAPSFLFLGVVIRWLDHVFWAFFYSHFAIFFVSLRIFLKVGVNFNF